MYGPLYGSTLVLRAADPERDVERVRTCARLRIDECGVAPASRVRDTSRDRERDCPRRSLRSPRSSSKRNP